MKIVTGIGFRDFKDLQCNCNASSKVDGSVFTTVNAEALLSSTNE